MRVVIDMQGMQTSSRSRGIGRYSFSLIQSIVEFGKEHEIFLLFNGALTNSIQELKPHFEQYLPKENIKIWLAEPPLGFIHRLGEDYVQNIQIIREVFIESLNPDVILVSSLFEGYNEDAVTSIRCFNTKTPVCVIFYDLIPLINKEEYLTKSPSYQSFYNEKLQFLNRADALMAISETTKEEGLNYLDSFAGIIENISFGINSKFRNLNYTQVQKKEVLKRFGIIKDPIIYVGGFDVRKNLSRLIKAYSLLSGNIRNHHPLVLIGSICKENMDNLQYEMKRQKLSEENIIFLGYIDDEQLIQIYNSSLLLVNPSWHEGIGLPILEAIACGLSFVCSDIKSYREILPNGCDLFFNPYDEVSISNAIGRQIDKLKNTSHENCNLYSNIVGEYSWKKVANKVFDIFETLVSTSQPEKPTSNKMMSLAYVSPMPPEKTGIANYSAELVKVLRQYYNITLICTQENISKMSIKEGVKDVIWFLKNNKQFDRILYHFGNSPFHQHMAHLLPLIPGLTVLHDFYLSNLVFSYHLNNPKSGVLEHALWESHGYRGLIDWLRNKDLVAIKNKYPMNLSILQNSRAIISHSMESKNLCQNWYGSNFKSNLNWNVIPLLREEIALKNKSEVRKSIGIDPEIFLVCTFGLIDPSKLNLELLKAWIDSKLTKNQKCKLVFVGENHGGDYGRDLLEIIQLHQKNYDIEILGWVDDDIFNKYLIAADAAVQLRTMSRGETSAAALSCLGAGIPTIINAHGSMNEIDSDCVLKLEDHFSQNSLVDALELLKINEEKRLELSEKGSLLIKNEFSPEECAKRYFEAIEKSYVNINVNYNNVVDSLILNNTSITMESLLTLSSVIAANFPIKNSTKKIYLDVSATFKNDLKTGIERVVRALVSELIQKPSTDIHFEPVFYDAVCRYRHAKTFVADLFGLSKENLTNTYVDIQPGDTILVLDNSGIDLIHSKKYLEKLKLSGVDVQFIIYDLLPILLPHVFPPGTCESHQKWLDVVLNSNGVICISRAVAEEFKQWVLVNSFNLDPNFKVNWFHLGADLENSSPSSWFCQNAQDTLVKMKSKKTFLVVSTIEPRKRHLQIIEAFESLWATGFDYQLVIVGKEGWKPLQASERRNIPETIKKIQNHQESGNRLFFLNNVSDQDLQKIYQESTCLIAASEGEGFGLPIIEAAQYQIPIIARDLPVFKEIAKDGAYYFSGMEGKDLAMAIKQWIQLYSLNSHPKSKNISYLSWQQSANLIADLLVED